MIVDSKSTLAYIGESLATEYLKSKGYDIVTRNFHSDHGEIDIVALEKSELVFCEVKTRCKHSVKTAENSISFRKRRRITHTAMHFVSSSPRFSKLSCRFDVLLIFRFNSEESYKIIHYKNAFQPIFEDY